MGRRQRQSLAWRSGCAVDESLSSTLVQHGRAAASIRAAAPVAHVRPVEEVLPMCCVAERQPDNINPPDPGRCHNKTGTPLLALESVPTPRLAHEAEKVEWSGTLSLRSRRQNQRKAR